MAAPDDAVLAADLEAEGFENATTVGRGGFGVVLRCRQRSLDRTVAIKVLTTDLDADNIARFLREQRAMGRLSGHPHIVNIHHYGTTPSGRPYIVMPYHQHGSLKDQIQRTGRLDWSNVLTLGVKMCGALETAHRIGTLHRDVKPANILLTDYDEPQLTDFGIAHIAGGFETSTGVITGSPAYTAPEVLQGRPPTAASDIYGLGATLFCALTGHAAFERRDGEKIVAQFLRITSHHVPDLREAGIPDQVSAAIEHAMATDPHERPTSAVEFGYRLRDIEQRNNLTVVDMALPPSARTDSPTEHDTTHTQCAQSTSSVVAAGRPSTAPTPPAPTPPTPTTKYRPPSPNRRLVIRPRLVDALRSGSERHLTLIHAHAGYGKTTLAAQWRDILIEEGTTVAWLSIDPDDDNVVWFLSHLVESIRQVQPPLGRELGQILEEHGDEAERYVLSTLINEIHRGAAPVCVVIDDWHRVSSSQTQAALAFLLDKCCHHLRIVVTSRSSSGLPLSRMRVRNELLEIDAATLRFDSSESRAFLVDLNGLALEQHDVDDLTDSTDGWVAALQLASLSLRGAADPSAMIGRLSGRHHAIGEFLAENVLDSLTPDLLDFLVATSIPDRICGSLAAALTDGSDGQSRLEDVEHRDLFLRRLDDEGDWFRYHHLFAEFLRRRVERHSPDHAVRLHRIAAQWFAEHHLLHEAVDHALAAGDERTALTLVERNQTYLLEQSQMATLLGLIGKLPPLAVEDSAPLQLAVAWANILLQRSDPAQAALQRLRPALRTSALSGTECESLRIEASVAESVIEIYADRTAGVADLVQEALERPDILRPWTVSVAANVATFVEISRFNYDAVPSLQAWARTYHNRTNGPFSVMYGYAFAGIAAYEQLEFADAESNFSKALDVARRSGGIHSHAARLAGALLGQLQYERGYLDEAEKLIEESYELGVEGGHVDFMIARFAVGARIKALRGDRSGAQERLDEGARAAAALHLDRLRARIDNDRALLRLPHPPTRALAPDIDLEVDAVTATTALLDDDTAIRHILLHGSPDDTARAVVRAQRWVAMLTGTRRRLAALQATRLLVSCLAAVGRGEEAKDRLAGAVAICAEQGMLRYLPDGGEDIEEMLDALRREQLAGSWAPTRPTVPESFLESIAPTES
ncbi:MAG: protein kinase [Rhodococcus sp. (in: high G+C Gram-positive bacteria)]